MLRGQDEDERVACKRFNMQLSIIQIVFDDGNINAAFQQRLMELFAVGDGDVDLERWDASFANEKQVLAS